MTSIYPARLAPWLYCPLALFAAVALSYLPLGRAAEAGLRSFDVPAGLADQTLKVFSDQAGVAVVFATDSAGRTKTNAVKGNYTTAEAMALLLRDSGLVAMASEKTGTFTITRDPNGPRATPAVTSSRPNPYPRPELDGVVTLSPFVVGENAEQGYYATETLNGTRIRSSVKDIGSSMTIFTKEMLDDLNLSSVDKLLMFSPNTDPFVVSSDQSTNYGATFILTPTQYVSRGGSTTVISQDFFTNDVPQDSYNSEAQTFTRGPNSVLFGQGDSAGGFNSSTKRAKNITATSLKLEGSRYNGFRASIDHNQVIKRNLLSIRYAGLYERTNLFQYPGEKRQERNFVTLTVTPFNKTEVRVGFEQGHLKQPAIRPWGVYDAISPWRDAGSPIVPTFVNSTTGKPAGTIAYPNAGLVSTEFTPAGTPIPIQTLRNQAQTAAATYSNGYPAWVNKRTLHDSSIFPEFATVDGASYRLTNFKSYSATLDQELPGKIFISAAAQRTDQMVNGVYDFVADQSYVYVDPNKTLPNGNTNPNFGKLYAESLVNLFLQPKLTDSYRVMASHELDLTRKSGWLRHLGRHRIAAFAERTEATASTGQMRIFNGTPLVKTGAAGQINNGNNLITYRYYFDPAAGQVGVPGRGPYDTVKTYLFSNSTLPIADPSGVTPVYIAIAASGSESILSTYGASAQSFLLKDRLVFTNGFRRDDAKLWQLTNVNTAAMADANGIRPDPSKISPRASFPGSLGKAGGFTYTRGIVAHILPWMSLTYNGSENFKPNTGSYNVYGELLPNPKGTGSDYGLRFNFFDNRLYVNLTYYKLHNVDQLDAINNAPSGNISNENNLMWAAIADFTGEAKYNTWPYNTSGQGWLDKATNTSSGTEFSITANPTESWRISFNGSKRGYSSTTSRGEVTNRYFQEFLPMIESHPEWMRLVSSGGILVSQRVSSLRTVLANFAAIKSLPALVYAPQWTMNLVANYTFPKASVFKGFSAGGSMNARGDAIAGFAEADGSAAGQLNPDRRYSTPAYQIFGAWLNYRHKALDGKVNVRWQLNVRNIWDRNNTVYPMRVVDSRDGKHSPSTAIYAFREPRTFTLSTSIGF